MLHISKSTTCRNRHYFIFSNNLKPNLTKRFSVKKQKKSEWVKREHLCVFSQSSWNPLWLDHLLACLLWHILLPLRFFLVKLDFQVGAGRESELPEVGLQVNRLFSPRFFSPCPSLLRSTWQVRLPLSPPHETANNRSFLEITWYL